MEEESLEILPDEEGIRLDKLLADRFKPRFSRTYFADLIDDGLVMVNGQKVKKREKLETGDVVEICFAERPEADLEPENIPLDIIYEDNDLLVINKPQGLVVHPAPGNWSGTFVNALLYHCRELKNTDPLRPGIVHRLDKDTTGLLLAAKHLEAQKRLIEAFSGRQVKKEYLAITYGKPREGTLKTLIGRDPKNRQKMAVVEEKGKEAISLIKVLKTEGELSKVQIKIETGRTHQIRVHLAHLKAPVLGDPVYGNKRANLRHQVETPLLHAWKLSFIHPFTHSEIQLTAEPPQTKFYIVD